MELLELVTGWLDVTANRFIKLGRVIFYEGWFRVEDKNQVVEEEGESRSVQGYRFEHEEIKALMYRLRNFETVEFTSARGTPLTPEMIEQR